MVPTGKPARKPCPAHPSQDVSLTYPGWNGVYGGPPPTEPCPVHSVRDASLTHPGLKWCVHETIPTNPRPVRSCGGCFPYTCMLKWCLEKLLPRTHTQYVLCRIFLLKIRAEIVPIGNSVHKPKPGTLSGECFLYIYLKVK